MLNLYQLTKTLGMTKKDRNGPQWTAILYL